MPSKPELSRLQALDHLPNGGVPFALEATPEEARALARRFDLVALDRLSASGRVDGLKGSDLVEVAGELKAEVQQRCVVTLEPVPARVSVAFRRLFSNEPEAVEEIEVDPEADLPEPFPEGGLDLGEVVAEELALALDPYPRSPGADAFLAEAQRRETELSGPFAALAAKRAH